MSDQGLDQTAIFGGNEFLTRATNLQEKSRPSRAVMLGFIDIANAGHTRPQHDYEYGILSAGSEELEKLGKPSTTNQLLDIDVFSFYSGDLPEGMFGGRNEGLMKIQAHTCFPQDRTGKEAVASWVKEFDVDDDTYAPGFLYGGVFRNILISGLANLSFELYEMDKDAAAYYSRFRAVVDKVPEIKSLDVLKGLPYLSLATNLFNGVVEVFGKNPDDHIWGEIPLLELDPLIGGAFLRDGIYLIIEAQRKDYKTIFEDLRYRNGRIYSQSGARLGAHLTFGLRLKEYHG